MHKTGLDALLRPEDSVLALIDDHRLRVQRVEGPPVDAVAAPQEQLQVYFRAGAACL
jgi:hypothetical protein